MMQPVRLALALVAALLASAAIPAGSAAEQPIGASRARATEAAGREGAGREPLRGVVTGVLDGETITVRIGERLETVRYIGIRVPLILHPTLGPAPYQRRAAAANAALVEGREVLLEFGRAPRDAAGRLLAFVTVDGRLVNAELVRAGFAEVATVPPDVRRRAELLALEAQAHAQQAGLWADPDAVRFHRRATSGVIAARRTMSFFHIDDDKAFAEEDREYFDSAEAALRAGYSPSFNYRVLAEREARRLAARPTYDVPAGAATAPAAPSAAAPAATTAPSAATAVVIPPAPAPAQHYLWRGGVLSPLGYR